MTNRNPIYRVYRFYADGFRAMTLGRTLWAVVLLKLLIMFGILKLFFFPDTLGGFENERQKGDYVIDMCAAPGGKSLHMGDKMGDYGTVDARDISQYKVDLIEENIHRTDSINVQARVMDATVFDVDSELKADIVLADVPCSGYGVIGKKPEIKYRVTPQKQEEIVILQRSILDRAAEYVKPGGVLVFSTCTIAKEENEENMLWFMNNHPFKLESLDPYLPEELHSESTALGYLQLLPGVHKTDGFFIAKFRRK